MSADFVGEIHTFHRDHEEIFEWIVPQIFSLSGRRSFCTYCFPCLGMEMDIHVSTALDSTLCALRIFDTAEGGASVLATVTLKPAGGKEEVLFRDGRFAKRKGIWFLIEILDLPVLDRVRYCLHAAGKVTITVRRESPPPGDKSTVCRETQTENTHVTDSRIELPAQLDMEDLSLLREHFKDLLLSGDDHDVIITVKNKQFKAHKCVLRARSPVFKAMFRNKMKESADGTVSIEDCDPEVFGKFLRYVYTGKLDFESASHAVGLFYVGDKYDLPRLKQNCIAFLKISLSTTTISNVITLATRHGEEELLQQGIVYFSKHMEEIMLTVEWQRFHASNPTEANEMCLKAVQCLRAFYTRKM